MDKMKSEQCQEKKVPPKHTVISEISAQMDLLCNTLDEFSRNPSIIAISQFQKSAIILILHSKAFFIK